MAAQLASVRGNSTPKENLYGVQRVLRALIWFAIFFVLGILTVVVSLLVGAASEALGIVFLNHWRVFLLDYPGDDQQNPICHPGVPTCRDPEIREICRRKRSWSILGVTLSAFL